jgi:hypothetical protein
VTRRRLPLPSRSGAESLKFATDNIASQYSLLRRRSQDMGLDGPFLSAGPDRFTDISVIR